ncbi:hypothetical protein NEPTK9_000601 [Candidatus Neptunochlamydia vexilliferae]|uniref:Uncharacterized protein n=1 Tax=Candidatus Neptunichlamydia vexilliferae TaxID=1651774 RepID=A0ABS0AYQ8_9BACT|nr:hypothetical protein [Candidatus Neptunochlamydia vexilliferae]
MSPCRLRISRGDQRAPQDHYSWKTTKLQECKQALARLFPFTSQENSFLESLMKNGEIRPSLLTSEPNMQAKITKLPSLHWRVSLAQKLI